MRRSWRSTILSALLPLSIWLAASLAAAQSEPRSQPARNTRTSLAQDVVAIARNGYVSDPAAVERVLNLPGLTAGLQWVEPPAWDRMSGSRATAWNRGRLAGVRNLVFQRGVGDEGAGARDWLSIVFHDGLCPSLSHYETAFGMRAGQTWIPQPHGGPPTDYRSFDLVSASGVPVHVAIDECAARLSMPSNPVAAR